MDEMYNLGLYYIKSNNSLFRDDINKVIIQHILNLNVIMMVYLSTHLNKLRAEHLNILQTSSCVLSSVK
jgi:hypothetical protein